MKKYMKMGLVMCLMAMLASCAKAEKEKETNSSKISKEADVSEAVSTVEEEKRPEIPEKSKEDILKEMTSDWVMEADYSKNTPFSYPSLKEEVFGMRAKEFNQETKKIHEVSKEFLEGENARDFAASVYYKVWLEPKTGTFSLLASHLTVNGEVFYRNFVVDVESKKELSYSEVVKRAGYTEEEVRNEMEEYYKTIYATVSYETLMQEKVDLEMEDYVGERLTSFEESVQPLVSSGINPTLYILNEEGNLDLYPIFRFPGFGGFFYKPYYVRKDLLQRTLLNKTSSSLLARINEPLDEDFRREAKIVKELSTELTGEHYYYMSVLDDVKVKITSIVYSEKAEDFFDNGILFEGKLKKGEIIALDTLIPEGLPILRIEAEGLLIDEETKASRLLRYEDEMGYNGRFVLPKIEYLEGWTE